MQNDLNKVVNWCANNKLNLNIDKCKVISFSRKVKLISFTYKCLDQDLEKVNEFKDLGVIFDSRLSFNSYIEIVIGEAFKVLGFVIRNSKDFNNVLVLKILFNSLVRSKLEYASIIWAPYYVHYKLKIERVQRRFLKHLYNASLGSFPKRGFAQEKLLEHFEYESLECRRQVSNVKLLTKLLVNKIDCAKILSFVKLQVPTANLRRNQTFFVPKSKTNTMKRSPLCALAEVGNIISDKVDVFNDSISACIEVILSKYQFVIC